MGPHQFLWGLPRVVLRTVNLPTGNQAPPFLLELKGCFGSAHDDKYLAATVDNHRYQRRIPKQPILFFLEVNDKFY
jgi:hypothetical protein